MGSIEELKSRRELNSKMYGHKRPISRKERPTINFEDRRCYVGESSLWSGSWIVLLDKPLIEKGREVLYDPHLNNLWEFNVLSQDSPAINPAKQIKGLCESKSDLVSYRMYEKLRHYEKEYRELSFREFKFHSIYETYGLFREEQQELNKSIYRTALGHLRSQREFKEKYGKGWDLV